MAVYLGEFFLFLFGRCCPEITMCSSFFLDSIIITPSNDSDERFKMQFLCYQLKTNTKINRRRS